MSRNDTLLPALMGHANARPLARHGDVAAVAHFNLDYRRRWSLVDQASFKLFPPGSVKLVQKN